MITIAMEAERIILAGAWTSLMLIYLLGDVLRIFAGHAEPGKMGGQETADCGRWPPRSCSSRSR